MDTVQVLMLMVTGGHGVNGVPVQKHVAQEKEGDKDFATTPLRHMGLRVAKEKNSKQTNVFLKHATVNIGHKNVEYI